MDAQHLHTRIAANERKPKPCPTQEIIARTQRCCQVLWSQLLSIENWLWSIVGHKSAQQSRNSVPTEEKFFVLFHIARRVADNNTNISVCANYDWWRLAQKIEKQQKAWFSGNSFWRNIYRSRSIVDCRVLFRSSLEAQEIYNLLTCCSDRGKNVLKSEELEKKVVSQLLVRLNFCIHFHPLVDFMFLNCILLAVFTHDETSPRWWLVAKSCRDMV